MYPANNGDAFLLVATVPKTVTILIDGGYASTYKKYISKDLISLAAQGHCLYLVVATHIDADHIMGLIWSEDIEQKLVKLKSKDDPQAYMYDVRYSFIASDNLLLSYAMKSIFLIEFNRPLVNNLYSDHRQNLFVKHLV